MELFGESAAGGREELIECIIERSSGVRKPLTPGWNE